MPRPNSEERYYLRIVKLQAIYSKLKLIFLLRIVRILAIPFIPFSNWIWQYRKQSRNRLGFIKMLSMNYARVISRTSLKILYIKGDSSINILPLVDLIGGENLEACRKTGRGIILVCTHSLGFRFLQHWINQWDQTWNPYLAKYYPEIPGNKWLMQNNHQGLIFQGRLLNAGFLKPVVRILRAGGTVLLTQDLSHPKAEKMPFLGKTMRNPLGAARLAEISDAMILPVTLGPQLVRCRWQIHFLPPIDPRDGGTRERLHSAIESLIMMYPELWDGWRELWKTID